MVTGIERWKEYFNDYKDKYVLIGGAACNLLEEELDMNPRATKDLDLVLVVEALTPDFGARLWDFIKSANYADRSKGENEFKHEYYRFTNPEDKAYPKQIELFARSTGILNLPSDAHIEPLSVGEDLSSLSAILMDDDYYAFTISILEISTTSILQVQKLSYVLKPRHTLKCWTEKLKANKWTAVISRSIRKMCSG